MTPNNPKVSIIIPFFNREKFLTESVESVLSQSFTNWELILIDDGSTVESTKIAQNFVEKYPDKIFLYAHEDGKNLGASASRNLGIKHSNGDFITFLDSDDCFFSNTLEIGISAFTQNPEAEAVCGTLQYWFSWSAENFANERDFVVNLGVPTEKLYQPPTLLIHNLRAGGRKPGIGCVILRGEFAKKHQLFENDFRYIGEDQILWAKICLNGNIFIVQNCFAKYRQHNNSSIKIGIKSGKETSDWEKYLTWLENYLQQNKIENSDLWNALRLCRKENNYKAKYQRLFDLYRRFFPYHLRYKIRDLIVKWRNRGNK